MCNIVPIALGKYKQFCLPSVHFVAAFPASILSKSTADRYRPVSYPDGPITARYRFIKNAYWVYCICLSLPLALRGLDVDLIVSVLELSYLLLIFFTVSLCLTSCIICLYFKLVNFQMLQNQTLTVLSALFPVSLVMCVYASIYLYLLFM